MKFEWDDANTSHIAEHHINPEEVEQAVCDSQRVPALVYRVASERRRGLLGSTDDGRLLFVVTVTHGQSIRVVTARNAKPTERPR